MSTFLIVDQDQNRCADICGFFRSVGHTLYAASDLPGARTQLEAHELDVVVSSVAVIGGSIHDLIEAAKERNAGTAVIVYTDIEGTQEGLDAVRDGAFGMVQKPFSLPELSFQIKRALEKRGQRSPAPVADLSPEVYKPYNFIGESPEIRKVFRIVSRVAKTDASVIVSGETGTGKELVAGAIHYNSPRAGGPFVRVNCAALPEQLLESELFGHERGAFTDASRMRVGRFEHANGGTIFLDEVADMSLFTQAKVLRVIQEKEFERLGSNATVKTDVRIISATNKDLTDLMRRSLFREDLYYRLNVVTIRLPPLRERGGDITLLIRFFLKKYSTEMEKRIHGIEPAAMRLLTSYEWPGNIRELENVIERAVLMAEGDLITAEDLSLFFSVESPSADAEEGIHLPVNGMTLEAAEREIIRQALERCGWVQKDAARLLGVSGRVLNYKIKTHGITHAGWRQNR
jgi:DNA-binding NtrC family response regulator